MRANSRAPPPDAFATSPRAFAGYGSRRRRRRRAARASTSTARAIHRRALDGIARARRVARASRVDAPRATVRARATHRSAHERRDVARAVFRARNLEIAPAPSRSHPIAARGVPALMLRSIRTRCLSVAFYHIQPFLYSIQGDSTNLFYPW